MVVTLGQQYNVGEKPTVILYVCMYGHYRECAAQSFGCMSNRQSTVDVCGANIGDQSQACETRSCLFLYPCSGVYICTDIHTEYSTHCIVFGLRIKISELYIISKSHGRAVQKQTMYIICTTTTAVSTQVS